MTPPRRLSLVFAGFVLIGCSSSTSTPEIPTDAALPDVTADGTPPDAPADGTLPAPDGTVADAPAEAQPDASDGAVQDAPDDRAQDAPDGGADVQHEASDGATCAVDASGPDAGPVCSAAKHLASAAEFLSELNSVAWQRVSVSRTGVLSLSGDFVADADLEVDASLLVQPADCPTTMADGSLIPAQCHTPLFREFAFPLWSSQPTSGGTGRVAGVSCKTVGDHPLHQGGATCARISIAMGTIFRVRAVVDDMHPSLLTYWPFIEFERACSATCDTGETRCAATQTCYAAGYASCAYCEGMAAPVCACRDACGSKAESSQCFYAAAPDYDVVGTCQAGMCSSTRDN